MSRDTASVDNFLDNISGVESGHGRNFNHPTIQSGMHAGHNAIGNYGLMPNTVDEVIDNNFNSDPAMGSISEMDPVSKKQYLEQNPEAERQIARTLAGKLLAKYNGNDEMAAYAWNQGHNLASDEIEDRGYEDSDYVQKYKAMKEKSFNPKAYLARKQQVKEVPKPTPTPEPEASKDNNNFDPKAYLANKQASTSTPSDDKYSELESAGLGALQGGSFGYADELEGAIKAGGAKLTGDNKNLLDLYQQYRDIARNKYKQAEEQNPKSFLVGNIGGGTATALIPGLGEANIAKLTAMGAATGLGSSEADLTKGEVGKAAIDTAVGAGTGYLAGKAGEAIGNFLSPETRQTAANVRAVKALGGKATDEALPVGQEVLKQGTLPIMGGGEAIQKSLTDRISDLEQNTIKPIFKNVSENSGLENVVNNRAGVEDIVDTLAKKAKASIPDTPAAKGAAKSIDAELEFWSEKIANANGDPSKLNEVRKQIDAYAKSVKPSVFNVSDQSLGPKYQFLRDLRDTLNTELRDISSKVSSGAGQDLKTSMDSQSKLIKASEMAESLKQRRADDNIPGKIFTKENLGILGGAELLKQAGMYGLLPGGGVAGGALAAGTIGKIAAEKITGQPIGRLGNIISARAQNAMAEGLSTTTGKIIQAGAKAITSKGLSSSGVQSGIQSIYSVNNSKLKEVADHFSQQKNTQPIAEALNSAIDSNDEDAKNKVLFAMEQRPDIRMQLRQLMNVQKEQSQTDDESSPNG